MADEVRVLAAGYGKLKFAGTLAKVADNLFTFLRYTGMPPTNNNSELDIRDWVVPQRNIRRKFMSRAGMAVFVILQSYAATCDNLGLRGVPDEDIRRATLQHIHRWLAGTGRGVERVCRAICAARTATPPVLPKPPARPQHAPPMLAQAPAKAKTCMVVTDWGDIPGRRAQAPARELKTHMQQALRSCINITAPYSESDYMIPEVQMRISSSMSYLSFRGKPPPTA